MKSTKAVYMIKRQVSRNRLQEFNEFNLMSFMTKKKNKVIKEMEIGNQGGKRK